MNTLPQLGWLSGCVRFRYARSASIAAREASTSPSGRRKRARVMIAPAGSSVNRYRSVSALRGTQPLSQPNCGSVFTNPPGDHAGRLIDSVGLKGARLGGAQISTLHANWIVNLGGARASDVLGLIERAQARVREATGIVLVPEVKRVGVFA